MPTVTNRCRNCGRRIVWGVTGDGKWIDLDPEWKELGTVRGTWVYIHDTDRIRPSDPTDDHITEHYQPHIDTCPNPQRSF